MATGQTSIPIADLRHDHQAVIIPAIGFEPDLPRLCSDLKNIEVEIETEGSVQRKSHSIAKTYAGTAEQVRFDKCDRNGELEGKSELLDLDVGSIVAWGVEIPRSQTGSRITGSP